MKATTTKPMTRQEIRELTGIRCNSPKLTDQSQANASDINTIAEQYQRTGMLPVTLKTPSYQYNTNIPSLEDAFKQANDAKDAFSNLPAHIRKLMDNDPSKLENFIADSDNAEILLKHGITIEKKEEPKQSTLNDVVDALKQITKPTETV